jgi:hypothetical protein
MIYVVDNRQFCIKLCQNFQKRRAFSLSAPAVWNSRPNATRSADRGMEYGQRFRLAIWMHYYQLAFIHWSRDCPLSRFACIRPIVHLTSVKNTFYCNKESVMKSDRLVQTSQVVLLASRLKSVGGCVIILIIDIINMNRYRLPSKS